MQLRKNLYQIRFARHNALSKIKKAIGLAFPNKDGKDTVLAIDKYTYLVYSEQDAKSVNVMIGINFEDDLDDFMVLRLDYESSMSTFTDRQDIINFIKMVKDDSFLSPDDVTQEEIDQILDKISRFGSDSLTNHERTVLKLF